MQTECATPTDDLQLFDVSDVAGKLRMSKRTVRDLIVRGHFPEADVKIGAKLHRWTAEQLRRGIAQLQDGRAAR